MSDEDAERERRIAGWKAKNQRERALTNEVWEEMPPEERAAQWRLLLAANYNHRHMATKLIDRSPFIRNMVVESVLAGNDPWGRSFTQNRETDAGVHPFTRELSDQDFADADAALAGEFRGARGPLASSVDT